MAAPFAPHQPEQVLCLRLAWHGGARQRGQAREPRLPRQVRTARAAPGTGPESRLLRPGLVLASSVGRSRIGAEGPAGGVWGARLVLRPGEELASLCLHSPASPAQAVAPFEKMVTTPPKPRDPGRVLALPICRVDVTAAPNKPLRRRRPSGPRTAADHRRSPVGASHGRRPRRSPVGAWRRRLERGGGAFSLPRSSPSPSWRIAHP